MESHDDFDISFDDYSERLSLSLMPRTSGEESKGSSLVLTEEDALVGDIRRAAAVLQQLAFCRQAAVCEVRIDRHRRPSIMCHVKTSFRHLCAMLRRDWVELRHHFPSHSVVPYVDAMVRILDRVPELREADPDADPTDAANKVNRFAEELSAVTKTADFRAAMRKRNDRCRVNTAKLKRYIDWVFATQGAKHLAIRIDLCYTKEDRFFTGRPINITRQQALRDFSRFKRWVAEKYPLSGHAWRLEYGLVSGYHFHVLFLLKGHDVWNGSRIGYNFGRQWDGVSTDGMGRHHNCNAGSYVRDGIGLIHRSDTKKLEMLKENAAIYLTKPDMWICEEGRRSFGKGQMPEQWVSSM